MSGFKIRETDDRIAVRHKRRIVFDLYNKLNDTLECDTEWGISLKWDYINNQKIDGMECNRIHGLELIAIFISGVLQ